MIPLQILCKAVIYISSYLIRGHGTSAIPSRVKQTFAIRFTTCLIRLNSPVATLFSPACKILISSNHRYREDTIDHQKTSCSGFFHQSLGIFTENKYPGIGSDMHQHTGPLIAAHLQKPRKKPSQDKRIHSLQDISMIDSEKRRRDHSGNQYGKMIPKSADRPASERSFLLQQALRSPSRRSS